MWPVYDRRIMHMPERGGGKWLLGLAVLVLAGLAGAYAHWAINRPLPLPQLRPNVYSVNLQMPTKPAKLAWPAAGQSAVAIIGSPVLESHGKQAATPTASTAKLITALAVLGRKPLKPGEQGPVITLTANDVAIYNAYLSRNGSLTKVQAGEQITEYQMLEAMLLPSANNMADSLAIWAFGSLPAYSAAANQYLKEHDLNGTRVGADASGFLPSTASTARDLVKIGELVMQNPVLAQVVGQPSAGSIPVVNNVKNVNSLLGTDNIVGVKTGNTDQAGGVFVSASRVSVNGRPVTIVTAVADSPSLWQAMHDSLPLIQSAQANFGKVTVVKTGQMVGTYELPWGGSVRAVAARDLTTQAWNGTPVTAIANLRPVNASAVAGQVAGSLAVSDPSATQKVDIKLAAAPGRPTVWWRLTHPF